MREEQRVRRGRFGNSLCISDVAIIHIMKHMVLVRRLSCPLTNSRQSHTLMSQDRKWLRIISEADPTEPHITQTVILWEPLMSTEEHGCWIYLTKKGNQRTYLNILDTPPNNNNLSASVWLEAMRRTADCKQGFYVILLRRKELGPSEPGASLPDQPHMILIQQLISHDSMTRKEGSVVTSLNLRRRVWWSAWSADSQVSGFNSSRFSSSQQNWLSVSSLLQLGLLEYGCIADVVICKGVLWDSDRAECDGDICILE